MAKITPEEVPESARKAYGRSLYGYDNETAGYGHRVAALLNDPAIQRLVVTKCVEAARDEDDDCVMFAPFVIASSDEILAALCPPETPNA